jgi:hypothetical protein
MSGNNRDDFERRFEEDDGVFPESWRPRPGDKCIGRLVRYTRGEGKFGPRTITVLQCSNDEGKPYLLSVWLSSAVLIEKFRRLRPKPGERVAIKRVADVEGANGRYANYVVHVDRPAESSMAALDALGQPEAADEQLSSRAGVEKGEVTSTADDEDLAF